MTLPSNQNELGPNALVITGFGSHPCHLFIYFFHTLLYGDALPSNLLSCSKQPRTQWSTRTWRHWDNIWASLMNSPGPADYLEKSVPRTHISQSCILGSPCGCHWLP
jgi:hypothetical protein